MEQNINHISLKCVMKEYGKTISFKGGGVFFIILQKQGENFLKTNQGDTNSLILFYSILFNDESCCGTVDVLEHGTIPDGAVVHFLK